MGSTGPDGDVLYRIASAPIERSGLSVRPDPIRPRKHAFIEPGRIEPLEEYEASLATTRPDRRRAWR
jgi:hypothetical protein